MAKPLRTFVVSRFARDERAALSVEAAVMLPLLAALYVAGIVWFDALRREAAITRASYVVGDLLSRRTGTVTVTDIEGLKAVFETMTGTQNRTWIRVTELIRCTDGLRVAWTHATDDKPVMTQNRLSGHLSQVPALSEGERIVITESFSDYDPVFNVGLDKRLAATFTPTRTRSGGRLVWQEPSAGCP